MMDVCEGRRHTGWSVKPFLYAHVHMHTRTHTHTHIHTYTRTYIFTQVRARSRPFQIHMFKSWPAAPQDGTVPGERAFEEVKMRPWGWVLIQHDWGSSREMECGHRRRHQGCRRACRKDQAETRREGGRLRVQERLQSETNSAHTLTLDVCPPELWGSKSVV